MRLFWRTATVGRSVVRWVSFDRVFFFLRRTGDSVPVNDTHGRIKEHRAAFYGPD